MKLSSFVKIFLALTIFFSICSVVFAEDKLDINFDYPSFNGDFYLSGTVFFPPGKVKLIKNIVVILKKMNKEIYSKITILKKWRDGSILSAEIIFATNASDRQQYMIIYGGHVLRKKIITETAVLPTISFSVGGVPNVSENIDISVGEINVKIAERHNIFYYWHIIPIILLIGITYFRYRKASKK